ncbi:SNO glutamine amidotransferase [Beutenbergia cavernae DSM 12333]|uniref:Pyridoxal 5'-phosphate synthase subunit PdxT n=1 Tax=Beutenbergia cavernae (strain ATCC BAA-8 / DSM 12333 / CCUG 43141 / JCM 11478 / NBRC 16432 / NCIMB 13614 / HKI 0122) TaxID=471853 RepID=C5C5Q2_BEUC1|nr:pyridoxal 5'-phosphate synthase glutaminase subunit PdxT [Beutenbergia cavernae]ACQ80243.1 SNO glutamine amidotransferase [Beutenbergia cavernae DSM 12333]
MTTVGVLALQGDFREHIAVLGSLGVSAVPVRRPSELDVDGLVLPGGESTTISKLLVTFGLLEPLREAVRSGLPVYGSCAGMILLADRILDGTVDQETIGGIDMTVRRNAFGRQVDSFEVDLDAPGLAGEAGSELLRAVFIRAPWAEDVGDGVEVLARVASGPAAGRIVAVRQGSLLATAFHPEIGADARVHSTFLRMIGA